MPTRSHIEGWFRPLLGDRLEVYFKVEGVQGVADRKIRASGPAGDMNELTDWFELKTGLKVNAPWRTISKNEIPGQIEFELVDDRAREPDAPQLDSGLSSAATL